MAHENLPNTKRYGILNWTKNLNRKQQLTRLELGTAVFPLHILLKISLFNSFPVKRTFSHTVQNKKHENLFVRQDFIRFDKLCDVTTEAHHAISHLARSD